MIRGHAFYTRRILEAISGLDVINEWASSHHERLDGDGYPFHDGDDELSLGARIVAVADVFTALAEDRPYRKAMTPDEILEILRQMTEDAKLDAKIVELLKGNFDEVNGVRMNAQLAAAKEYNEFVQALSVATG